MRYRGLRFRHVVVNDGFHQAGLPVEQVEPRADLHFAADAHFALVARRHEFGADMRQQQQAGRKDRGTKQDHDVAVAQRMR